MNIIKRIKEINDNIIFRNRFKKYMTQVKSQLTCNATERYKDHFITYTYSNEEIDSNTAYFKHCFKSNLSSYKALLFLSDYIEENILSDNKRLN